MLPFLKHKFDTSPDEHDSNAPSTPAPFDVLQLVSNEILDAIQNKDRIKFKQALKAFFTVCESKPHNENNGEI